jgi:rsbT co-antagonist protein RsbR
MEESVTIDERETMKLELGASETKDERLVAHQAETSQHAEDVARLMTQLEDRTRVLSATLDAIADGVAVTDLEGNFLHFNPAAEEIAGLGRVQAPPDEWTAKYGVFRGDMVTPFPPAELPLVRALGGEHVDGVELFMRHHRKPDGIWVLASARPVVDERRAIRGGVVVFRDISDRKRWEAELELQLVREREKTLALERMRNAMQELSTPILEIWDDVLALPVIGVVDSRRSADMMERLLREVEHKQCRFVIIDITGVEVIDTATADHFLKIVSAVGILGARCVLTGARGAVAQTLASLGMDLGPLVTLRNLKHALRECLRMMDDGNKQSPLREVFAARQGGHRG